MTRLALGALVMMGVLTVCILAPKWVDRDAWTGASTTFFFFIGFWLIAGRKDRT